MSNLHWPNNDQMARVRSFFPKSHGKPHLDDRRILRGITSFKRNDLPWYDAPREYGAARTRYDRWNRWGDKGVFARLMEGFVSAAAAPKTGKIDATCLKAHPVTASPELKKGARSSDWSSQELHGHQIACRY